MTADHPDNLNEMLSVIAEAMADGTPLSVSGCASKSDWGYAIADARPVSVDRWAGIIDYQPDELILTVRAGTPMTEINKTLANKNQMLGFEPPDPSVLFAKTDLSNKGSIGGVLATNSSGSRRLTAGAARDFLLGFEAASGRGERFRSGGKVVKNVTGYDLSKLICGSFGTLAIMDELTLKTLPRPEVSKSVLIPAVDLAAAVRNIAAILATPHEPSAAAILPSDIVALASLDSSLDSGLDYGQMLAVIRFEGFAISVNDRVNAVLSLYPDGDSIDDAASQTLWQAIGNTALLADAAGDIWKLSCAPSAAPSVINALPDEWPLRYYADWAGGLLWLDVPSGGVAGTILRQVLADHGGGFAQLIRDAGNTRSLVPPFQPLPSPQLALHKRIKAAFDPKGILNPGRMHHAI
jgi:glycolate oxidase FAD binding subunit